MSSIQGQTGFPYEGIDIDSISDITGISMNKLDHAEQGSQHSGSFGSDNTEALLSVSLRDFEDNESLLESVSQVDVSLSTAYKSPKDRVTGYEGKDTEHLKASIIDENFPTHPTKREVTFVHAGMSEDSSLHNNVMHEAFLNRGSDARHGIQGDTSFQYSQSFEQSTNFDQGFNSNGKKSGNVYKVTRKISSDSDVMLSGRESVIKHHSSLVPSVNPESLANTTNFDPKQSPLNTHLDSKSKIVGNQGKPVNESRHLSWGPSELIRDNAWLMRDMDGHGVMKEGSFLHNGENMSDVRQGNIEGTRVRNSGTIRYQTDDSRGEYDGYPANVKFEDEHVMGAFISGTERGVPNEEGCYENSTNQGKGHEEIPWKNSHFHDNSIEQRREEEMLLGVKHDPETNELYDDKVREGADLLSKLLGGDHNASITSHSSRSSDRNVKSSSLREKASLYKQRSLDSSVHSEPTQPRQPRSSSPKNSISRNDDQSGKLRSSRGDRVPLRHHRSLDSLNTDTRFHENFSPKHYDQPTPGHSFVDAKEREDSSKETQIGRGNKADKLLHYSLKISKNGQKEYNFLQNGNNVSKSESSREQGFDMAPSEGTDLNQLELDIEEILSRKKLATHELQILEESLQRNKADMKSSESLVEQYRWQATQTRSELMDLEERRSQLQEECIALDGVIKKSKQNEAFNSDEVLFGRSKDEIYRALQEREQFKQDLDSMQETLKREQRKAKMAQDDLRENVRRLEEQLSKQHEENVKNFQMMKEERKSHMEILEEKLKRETHQWKRAAENGDMRIKQLEESLFERNDELDKVRKLFREEKQKNLDIEKRWRAQLESERQDADIKYDGQERSWKEREVKLLEQHQELEKLVEERTTDFRRSEERCKSQTEELQKIIENKNEEMKMVRGLVRQQEDATRVLGERLRNEAREHVRNAVEKERQSLDKEKERIKRAIHDEKEKRERIVKQMTEELNIEKERHSQTKETLNKLKQEGDDLRKQLVEVHGERITSVQKARHENGEELEKIKQKLHEFTSQADQLEKIDQETAKAIYEECRKIAEMVDMPLSHKTPSSFSSERLSGDARESPTKEALASLRQCNEELRRRLSEMKNQMARHPTQTDHAGETSSTSELSELRKRLAGKEEEIQRLQRKHNEEIEQLKDEKKKEQLSYRKTVAKLEQEFQKLVATKTSSTPCKTKREISRSTIATSSNGTVTQSSSVSPASRSVEKSSSADLLKHLQDRVKKLRAENENLKKSSDKESLARKTRNSDVALLQSKGLTISQLHTPAKSRGSMSDNIEQVTRIQRLLANSTKDD